MPFAEMLFFVLEALLARKVMELHAMWNMVGKVMRMYYVDG
jgi:hypothetical protein